MLRTGSAGPPGATCGRRLCRYQTSALFPQRFHQPVSTDLSSHNCPPEKVGHGSTGCEVGHGSPGCQVLKMDTEARAVKSDTEARAVSLIVVHNGAGGCARSVHTILEQQTQASLVLTLSVKYEVRLACLHPPPQVERRVSDTCVPCC